MRRKPERASTEIPLILGFLLLLCLIIASCLINYHGAPIGYKIVNKGIILASAYNSLPNQTDDTPWTTASGTKCREGVVASNYFPIGTKLMIEGYKGRVFVVEDRMNARYGKKIDIWFRDYDDAMKFGNRKIKYYVLAQV